MFPEFEYQEGPFNISFPPGYINWKDLHDIYDKDKTLKSNFRKAPKLSYQALHPGNNKQNSLAIAVFHETTIAAAKSYFPNRKDLVGFFTVINWWWNIANSKMKFFPNSLSNAIVFGNKKTDFYRALAN